MGALSTRLARAAVAELHPDQRAFFHEHGYLMVEDAVDSALLARLRRDFAAWVEESRAHDAAWGDTVDGPAALQPGARPQQRGAGPAPVEVSEAYLAATAESRMADCVAELIGPDVKLHHTKINSKLPGSHAQVKWHQDFAFTPHSNDHVVSALLMVDEVTEENGPLQVLPGSHRGPIHSLWHGGVFTGAVADACMASARTCTGAACLMHTRLLHGSAANRSARPRTLHRGLQRRRCGRDLAQSGAEPLRGAARARAAHRVGALDRLRAGAAAAADRGLVLRPAGPPRGDGRHRPVSEAPDIVGHYTSGGLLARLEAALREDGVDPAHPSTEALAPYDHFHGRGLEATEDMAAQLRIAASDRILDVGSGLGGPARYLARRFDCRVSGIDLTAEFCAVARHLTALLEMEERVSVRQGDALAMRRSTAPTR